MIRTQIYLTEKEREGLMALAGDEGKKMSHLIREAIDLFIEQRQTNERTEALKELAGLWKSREDLPDFAALRKEPDETGEG